MICHTEIILLSGLSRSDPGEGLKRATEGRSAIYHMYSSVLHEVVGCAVISFRGIAFYKVPLHAFADALRPGTPR